MADRQDGQGQDPGDSRFAADVVRDWRDSGVEDHLADITPCIGQWCCGCETHPLGKPWGWNADSWELHRLECGCGTTGDAERRPPESASQSGAGRMADRPGDPGLGHPADRPGRA